MWIIKQKLSTSLHRLLINSFMLLYIATYIANIKQNNVIILFVWRNCRNKQTEEACVQILAEQEKKGKKQKVKVKPKISLPWINVGMCLFYLLLHQWHTYHNHLKAQSHVCGWNAGRFSEDSSAASPLPLLCLCYFNGSINKWWCFSEAITSKSSLTATGCVHERRPGALRRSRKLPCWRSSVY